MLPCSNCRSILSFYFNCLRGEPHVDPARWDYQRELPAHTEILPRRSQALARVAGGEQAPDGQRIVSFCENRRRQNAFAAAVSINGKFASARTALRLYREAPA